MRNNNKKPKSRIISEVVGLCLITLLFFLFLNSSQCALSKPLNFNLFKEQSSTLLPEGSFQYTVKFQDTILFNKQAFINEYWKEEGVELEKLSYIQKRKIAANKKNNKFGETAGEKYKFDDILYTGYIKVENFKDDYKIYDVAGSYFPLNNSHPNTYTPINIISQTSTKNGLELLWYQDFNERSTNKQDTLWLTKANYSSASKEFKGYTAVLSCNSITCNLKNIAQWSAESIADINLYSMHTSSWKVYAAKVLRLFLSDETVLKVLKVKPFKPGTSYSEYYPLSLIENFKEYVNANTIKVFGSLPANAVTPWPRREPAPIFKEICDPYYCTRTQRFWEGANQQAKIDTCSSHIAGARSLCCELDGGGNLTGQELTTGSPLRSACFCSQANSQISSGTCCRTYVSCKQNLQSTTAASSVFTFQNYGNNKNMEVPPDYEIYSALHLNTLANRLILKSQSGTLHYASPVKYAGSSTEVLDDILSHFLPGNDYSHTILENKLCNGAAALDATSSPELVCIPYSPEYIFREEYIEVGNIGGTSLKRTNRVYDYFEYPIP